MRLFSSRLVLLTAAARAAASVALRPPQSGPIGIPPPGGPTGRPIGVSSCSHSLRTSSAEREWADSLWCHRPV
eukprot:5145264-Pyramimonas_sp.AAC.1